MGTTVIILNCHCPRQYNHHHYQHYYGAMHYVYFCIFVMKSLLCIVYYVLCNQQSITSYHTVHCISINIAKHLVNEIAVTLQVNLLMKSSNKTIISLTCYETVSYIQKIYFLSSYFCPVFTHLVPCTLTLFYLHSPCPIYTHPVLFTPTLSFVYLIIYLSQSCV